MACPIFYFMFIYVFTAAFWNEIVTAYNLLAQCCLSVVLSLISRREWVLLENRCAAEFLHTILHYTDSYCVIYVMNSVSDTPVVRKQCLFNAFVVVDYLLFEMWTVSSCIWALTLSNFRSTNDEEMIWNADSRKNVSWYMEYLEYGIYTVL